MNPPGLEANILKFDLQIRNMVFQFAFVVNQHPEILIFLLKRNSKNTKILRPEVLMTMKRDYRTFFRTNKQLKLYADLGEFPKEVKHLVLRQDNYQVIRVQLIEELHQSNSLKLSHDLLHVNIKKCGRYLRPLVDSILEMNLATLVLKMYLGV